MICVCNIEYWLINVHWVPIMNDMIIDDNKESDTNLRAKCPNKNYVSI